MKRIHLFEFEDMSWFPGWIRTSLTNLMSVMHRLLHTDKELAALINRTLATSPTNNIVDLCSGSGGPLPDALTILKQQYNITGLTLTLTDLYPGKIPRNKTGSNSDITYIKEPVDAAHVPTELTGLRTMICSFHHMKPGTAKDILNHARQEKQPICILEISDNSFPGALWWLALPLNFITALVITPFCRPLTVAQLLFTYIIPIIPFFFAWDGAVSNARTYTLKDLDILLEGLYSDDYIWEKGIIKGKSNKIYLLGYPQARL